MSYCRFIECDVYAYDSEDGVQFYVARSVGEGLDRLCPTYNEAYQYAKSLRDKHGADIPDHAIHALRAEALEEAERISGPKSVVAELNAENARIRTQLADVTESMGRVEERCANLRERVAELEELLPDSGRWYRAETVEAYVAENAKLRELVAAYDSALHRLCDQTQGHVDCDGCILGKDYRNEDICALDELRDSIMGLGVEVDE